MSLPTEDRRPLAFVAGGSRGLGLAIARRLAERGYDLALCARDDAELGRAADQLRAGGAVVATHVCDVADGDAVGTLVAELERRPGGVEVLLHVAGVIQVGPLAALGEEQFAEAVSIMLWGPIHTALALTPSMVARGHGRIGIVSSVGGLVSVPHLLLYSTAKFGATGFSRGLRSELSGTGVTVTTITPGLMRTGSHLNAEFVGDQGRELAWFATGASLPLVSMDADRAAGRIVDAVLAGRAVVAPTPLAVLGPRVDALFPSATSALLGLAARLLPPTPTSGAGTRVVPGHEAQNRLSPRGRRRLDRLTTLGRRAAARLNELGGTR